MRRWLSLLVLVLLSASGVARAQSQITFAMTSSNCAQSPQYGYVQWCFDTTAHTINYWSGSVFVVIPGQSGTVSSFSGANGLIVTNPTTTPALTIPNNIAYAAGYSGATADVKIAAAMAVACTQTGFNQTPIANGIVDARGLKGSQSIAATITMRPNCQIWFGPGTWLFAAGAQILFDSGDVIQGETPALGYVSQRGTQFQQTAGDTQPMLAYVNGTSGNGAYGVFIENLSLYVASNTPGSLGISFLHTTKSQVNNVAISAAFDTGLKLGFTGGCDCYNSFHEDFIGGTTYGVYILGGSYANENQFYGGTIGSSGVGIYLGGVVNDLFGIDFENSGVGVEFASAADSVYSPYLEGNSTDYQFDSGVVGNMVWGGASASITDNSGNTSNLYFTTGTGANQGGQSPALFASNKFRVGGNLYAGANNGGDISLVGGVDGGLQFSWSNSATYGRTGLFPVSLGPLTELGPATASSIKIGQSTAPTPVITQGGTPGSTTYTYYLVCENAGTGYATLPSAVATTTTGNATLNATNYNIITYACGSGFNQAALLSGGTSGSVLLQAVASTNPNGVFNDKGGALTSFTAIARNTTGDFTIPSGGIEHHTPIAVTSLPAACTAGDEIFVNNWNGTNGVCTGGGSIPTPATCGASNTWYCP